ncbi:UNVERIFIED_CONTAM: Retrovirus-related Pol polyprotein from transposon RE1, partial [Sesamum latifolium]
ELRSFLQAQQSSEWRAAMQHELEALDKNQIWEITPLLPNKKAIGCRWVYKLKIRAYGSIGKYKARLVAKSYNQVEGIDFVDSFSPVAKPVTVRILLAIATSKNCICKLKRFLYGLKQASGQWNMEFTNKLADFGFSQSQHDHYPFTKNTSTDLTVLLGYIDDVLIEGASEEFILEVKAYLDSLFTIKDIGVAKYFLGLEIARSSQGIAVTQSKRLVGKLLYLGFTRLDISQATQQLSQFLKQPYKQHLDAAVHLLRYLKGYSAKGLFFPATISTDLVAYCDAYWGSCVDSRNSLLGYCIFLGSALISWKTKKQNIISRSTTEAEYRSMSSTACKLTWVYNLLLDFQVQVNTPNSFLV